MINGKRGPSGGPRAVGLGSSREEAVRTQTREEGAASSQGERPQKTPALKAPWPRAPGLPVCERTCSAA